MRTVLGVLCFGFALFGAQSSDPKQWTVEGDVTTDNGPAVGASVSASGPVWLKDVSTDSKGHYVLKGMAPGYHLLSAHLEGAAPSKAKAVQVSAGTHLTSIDFHLPKESVISGRVLDADQNPIEGIDVSACVKTYREGRLIVGPCEHSKTDDLGEYRIAGLSEGRYLLTAGAQPSKPRKRVPGPNRAASRSKPIMTLVSRCYYPGVRSIESAVPIVIHESEQRGAVDLVLPKTESFCVRAAVVSSSVEPSAVIRLDAVVGDYFSTLANGMVKAGEESEICGVPPGSYRLSASAWDPDTKKVRSFAQSEVIVADRDADAGKIYPGPCIAIHGKLTVAGASPDDPLPTGIVVGLSRRGFPFLYGESLENPVKADGTFAIENALPHEYGLYVEGLPNGYYIREATQQSIDVTHGPVQPGRGDLLISLGSDGGTLRGKTVDKDGNPVPDATIILLAANRKDNVPTLTRQSDQSGAFELGSGIAPGDYQILALTGVYEGEASDPAFVASQLSNATKVTADPKSSQNLTLKVTSAH